MSDWQESANCAGLGDNTFFPDNRGAAKHEVSKVRETWCKPCHVRTECLEYALTHDAGRSGRRRARRTQARAEDGMSRIDLSDLHLTHEQTERETLIAAMAAVLAMVGDDREVIDAIFAPVQS